MNNKGITTIDTVADFFISQIDMTPKKLQKICYYAYAWYLTMYGERLFDEQFEGWVHGPVSPQLYRKYSGYGWCCIPKKEKPHLECNLEEFLNIILNTFGEYDGNELEAMTHAETPWIESRKGLSSEQAGNVVINDDTMKAFYDRLRNDGQVE